MIVKVILNTNQEIEIYDSTIDQIEGVDIAYRHVPDGGIALSISKFDSVDELPLLTCWHRLTSAMKEPEVESIQSICIENNDEIIFTQNNIMNYMYNVTFGNPIRESIDFEFKE